MAGNLVVELELLFFRRKVGGGCQAVTFAVEPGPCPRKFPMRTDVGGIPDACFHQIFFDNDLWILDPATDLLINIVPEPFFMDTALYIVLLFGASMLLLFAVSL